MTRFSTYNKRKPERKRSKARAVALDFFLESFLSSGSELACVAGKRVHAVMLHRRQEQLLPVPAQRSTFRPAPGGSYPFFYWILELAVAVLSLSPSIFFSSSFCI